MNDPRQDDFREAVRMVLLGLSRYQDVGGFLIASKTEGERLVDDLKRLADNFARKVEEKERTNFLALATRDHLVRFFELFSERVRVVKGCDDLSAYQYAERETHLESEVLAPLSRQIDKPIGQLVSRVKEHTNRAMLNKHRGPLGLTYVVLQGFGFPGETHLRKVDSLRSEMKFSPPIGMAYFLLSDVLGFPRESVAAAIGILGEKEIEARMNISAQQTLRQSDGDGGH